VTMSITTAATGATTTVTGIKGSRDRGLVHRLPTSKAVFRGLDCFGLHIVDQKRKG